MNLPIFEVLDELKANLAKTNLVILQAPPGAGKTTVIPLALLEESWLKDKSILVLEPRRLAAINAANRMSKSIGEVAGGVVGYRIRFDSKVSNKTKIEVVTEGIFTRRIQSDPELKNIGLVIFDEFHERNLQTDLGLAFALEVQGAYREDLKILIMSATLDGNHLSNFFSAPLIESQGKAFPVEVKHLGLSKEKLNSSILTAIQKALKEKGDILVFLPGSGEIKKIQREIEENLNLTDTLIYPLYGDLSQKEQELAIFPDKSGKRKIILSTNIAESSLTIEGVSIVIDSGLARVPRFDPSTGMTELVTIQIAKDSMEQRTGRAGRLGPGISYRIWSKEEERNFSEKTKPEILETELSSFLLEILNWGSRLKDLKFLDMPSESSVSRSKSLLLSLNLIDKQEKITDLGKEINRIPLHPRLGYMLYQTKDTKEFYLACLIASILTEKSLFTANHFSFKQSDIALEVEEFLKNQNSYLTQKIKLSTEELMRTLQTESKSKTENIDISQIGKILSFAYIDRIAKQREKNSNRFKLSSGKGAFLRENDSLIGNEFLVVASLDGDKKEAAIFKAAKISLEEILSTHSNKILKQERAFLEEKSGKILVQEEVVLGELVLSAKEKDSKITEELLSNLWIDYIKERGLSVLAYTEESKNFKERSEFLRSNGEDLPDLSDEYLLLHLEDWLSPYLISIRKLSELRNLDLLSIFKSLFSYDQIQLIEKEAPERWTVPSGSKIKLEYRKEEVILSVKLQELFGLKETPTIAKGKVKLTLELLSPSQRPIQITKDLAGFWERTYLEVKKELAGRYPKHPWPDNPLEAQATRFTKNRINQT
ncbi:MAG TPA: ATP-dependent helicase HrpB [Leptospiraceae bacterium]|nr:ATP-dependent helicase HrpB [Leptospiraceae bacterium]HMW07124.1 ATP-dependent helicase HrpB [Leptospiraceae bacterium]HMX31798.1 ATP-dependent helicase HrpB [Leptospiraceae bacterium]HMY32559.1 ATP-dependent helicase HrpB [Leptospiraceae bacterium]HMZ63907.1 ATP-dependent helicase HrpB [Leptospiraceae bacterium]